MRTTAILALLLMPTISFANPNMPALEGSWTSIACELRPQKGPDGVQPWYLKRHVEFSGSRIDAHFTTYADATCQTPLVDLKFGGDVTVQGPSPLAERAMLVDLSVSDYLRIAPRLGGFADFLNSGDPHTCGNEKWVVGTEQNILSSGCAVMGVAPNTPTQEFEVLYVSAGHLYFGARPVTGVPLLAPEDRPTTLQMPLKLAAGGLTQRVGADDIRVPQIVETVRFKQVPDADPAKVRAWFEAITTRMNQNDTLLYRSVAQGPDGTWLCINYWTSLKDMEALNTQAQSWSEAFSEMADLVDVGSFQLDHFQLN